MRFARPPWLVLIILTGLVRAGASTPVVFNQGWFPSAQFAGVYVALDAGLYAAAGLEVTVTPFAYGQDSTALLQRDPDTATLGSIEGYVLLQKLDRGDDLVAFAPMLRESPAGFMTLADSGITSAAEFAGRPVGVHAYADALFYWFCRNAGIAPEAVQLVRVEDDVSELLSGRVDAMQGYASEEYVRLQTRAVPRETRFLSFAALGFASYSEILYTTREQADRHAVVFAAFVTATREGWRRAFAEPELSVAAVARRAGAETAAERAHLAAALTALRPYVMGSDGQPLPPMAAAKWRRAQQIALEMELISRPPADPASWLWPLE